MTYHDLNTKHSSIWHLFNETEGKVKDNMQCRFFILIGNVNTSFLFLMN